MLEPDISGLIILVPEADFLRQACTNLLPPDARQSVAAHITLLFPFLPLQSLNAALLAELETLFRSHPAFAYTLTHVGRFKEAIYLTPEPEQPFVDLIADLTAHFPECQPYGGKFTKITPHLTVVQAQDPTFLDSIEKEAVQLCKHELPLHLEAREVTLVVRQAGVWSQRAVFSLG